MTLTRTDRRLGARRATHFSSRRCAAFGAPHDRRTASAASPRPRAVPARRHARSLIGANLRTYQRLSAEQPAGELQISRTGAHQFNCVLTYPSGESVRIFPCAAMSGRSMRGFSNGRQSRIWWDLTPLIASNESAADTRTIEDERNQPRTVYPLNPPDRVDLWDLVHRYHPGCRGSMRSMAALPICPWRTRRCMKSRSPRAA